MDKQIFKKKMNDSKVSSELDMNYIRDIMSKSISKSPEIMGRKGVYNLVIVMEELSELQKEVSKDIRNKDNHYDLIEEVADVMLGMEYIKQICGITDEEIHKAMNIKTERLDNKLKDSDYYH